MLLFYFPGVDFLVDEANKKESSLLLSAEILTKYLKSNNLPSEAMEKITKKVDKLFATYEGIVEYVPKGAEHKVTGKYLNLDG